MFVIRNIATRQLLSGFSIWRSKPIWRNPRDGYSIHNVLAFANLHIAANCVDELKATHNIDAEVCTTGLSPVEVE